MSKVYSNFVYVLKKGERPEAAVPHFKTFSGMDLPYWREFYLLGEAEELAEKIRAKSGEPRRLRAHRAEPARLGDGAARAARRARCCRGWRSPERGLTRSSAASPRRAASSASRIPASSPAGAAFSTTSSCPGSLHAVFVRSTLAHAVRLRRSTRAAARRAPGVATCSTGARSRRRRRAARAAPRGAGLHRRPSGMPWRPRARASSASRSPSWSRTRPMRRPTPCELVRADYESLPAVATIDAALAEDAARLHAEHRAATCSSSAATGTATSSGAFAAAAVVVSGDASTHARLSASPLEPRGVIARWDGRRPHGVDGHAGAAHRARRARRGLRTRRAAGARHRARHGRRVRPEDARDARGPRGGGLAARLIDRPVKWIGDAAREPRRRRRRRARRAWTSRPPPTRDGVLLALRARIWSDAGVAAHLPAHGLARADGHREHPAGPVPHARPTRTTSWPSPRTSRRSARIAASA